MSAMGDFATAVATCQITEQGELIYVTDMPRPRNFAKRIECHRSAA